MTSTSDREEPYERLVKTAYDLFASNGVPTVGVDRIVAEAGVAKMTLYRHFRSKDELVVAALDLREKLWTNEWLIAEVTRRATTPDGRLLAIFDLFDEWFRRDDFEGCMFMNSLVESHDSTSRIGAAGIEKLENVRRFAESLGEELGLPDADVFSSQWQLLMYGAIIQAIQGNRDAARHAKPVALALLESRRAG
jgi:AcrR family transcriptional regulator